MRRILLLVGPFITMPSLSAQLDTLPEVNQRVVSHVRAHVGEKVGRGECWDLAAAALNEAHANWDGGYGFGRKVDPQREAVLAGDIVQFEGVELQWEEGLDIHTERMPHHTAIIYEVRSPGVYVIAQQNTRAIGRKVGLGELMLARRTKGTITIHRPME